ncbi:MAG: hypothetical protein H6644_09560 [Caldilineaceae bacterium]|nr:hypothetical protein [Caldilineaceae bacterium]
MHKHFRSTTAAAAAPRSTRWIPPASQRLAVVAALVFTAAWLAWPGTARADAPFGVEAPIATNADDALSVHAADVDGDGGDQTSPASFLDDTIAWYENTAGDGSTWVYHVIATDADGAQSVYAADARRRQHLSTSFPPHTQQPATIAWYENTAGDSSAYRPSARDRYRRVCNLGLSMPQI